MISMKDRIPQEFYRSAFNLLPSIDLVLDQEDAALIMGGPSDMAFNMCLMGNGNYKSGMEHHIYQELNPSYSFQKFECNFSSLGLASACWQGLQLSELADRIIDNGGEVLGESLLPLREDARPNGIVYKGLAGEIIELKS